MNTARFLAVGLLAMAMAGCGGDSGGGADTATESTDGGAMRDAAVSKAIEAAAAAQGEEVEVDIDSTTGGADIKAKTNDGDVEMSSDNGAQLPEGLPEDVPILPGMKIRFSQRESQDNAYTIVGVTGKSLAEAAGFFKKEAAAQRWSEASSQEMDMGSITMHTLSFEKEQRNLTINITRQEDETQVQIVTGGQ
ncbi:MAG: hypothetical protein ACLFTT_14490 [Candidatus Hydrogenedentota bacterium]